MDRHLIEIREITSKDFKAWHALYSSFSKNLNDKDLRQLFNWLIDPNENSFCLVATEEDQMVGFVHYREYIRPFLAAKCLYMDDVLVAPDMRSKGIGSKLISTLAMRGLEAGYAHMQWAGLKENTRAHKLYTTLGSQKPLNLYEINFG